jgi:hypothetical protein
VDSKGGALKIWEHRPVRCLETVSDPGVSVRSQVQKPVEPSSVADAKRDPVWPMLTIVLGLSASLVWSGLLLWIVGRISGVL